ncbi:hypothetical protein E5D57_001465 [Metarhizium anisopliae]|nr:hypothetical protein E5D57_001465 [Metarhizium anisopliae]
MTPADKINRPVSFSKLAVKVYLSSATVANNLHYPSAIPVDAWAMITKAIFHGPPLTAQPRVRHDYWDPLLLLAVAEMWLLVDMKYKIFTALHLARVKALFPNSSASSTVIAMPRIYLQARLTRPHGKLNVVSSVGNLSTDVDEM